MRYGIPYLGSKNKIAKWVVDHLPPAETFVDIFAGGCAVTHAAMLSGKYKRFIVNDLGEAPKLFLDGINEKIRNYAPPPTRSEFNMLRRNDILTALVYSFSTNGVDYAYSPAIEKVSLPAETMILAPTSAERYSAYKRFLAALSDYMAMGGRIDSFKRLVGVERLARIMNLRLLADHVRPDRQQADYRDVRIPKDAIIYADPPYRGRRQTGYLKENLNAHSGFDYSAFDDWLEQAPLTVISEYEPPKNCVEVARTKKQVKVNNTNQGSAIAVEKLFVHKRHLQEYMERMGAKT